VIQLLRQAQALQRFADERGWRSCVIGGIAVIRWGEPRLTRDVDVSLFTGFGAEEMFVRPLLQEFEPRVSGALEFALANRVVLLAGPEGVPMDIALAGLPFEEEMIARATDFEFVAGVSLRTVSAEDLIVLKAFANRPRDWVDIEGIVARQVGGLRWADVHDRLEPLAGLKDEPGILERLDRARHESERAG
jgi:hypothetical protein